MGDCPVSPGLARLTRGTGDSHRLVVSVLVGAVGYRIIEHPTGKPPGRSAGGTAGRLRNYHPALTSTGNG